MLDTKELHWEALAPSQVGKGSRLQKTSWEPEENLSNAQEKVESFGKARGSWEQALPRALSLA